jgi:NAD(P)-dependent dehydrogenase (short-subunit alcohol dehydrogenase family)/rhamnose utilization protein RhaD (predicted bifunctional aldolase and dehydrogenase)
MDRALADLVEISKRVGRDPALVGVGGGNTSVKTDDGRHMYIKASGVHIGEVAEEVGWRRLNLGTVRSILTDRWVAQLPEEKRQAAIVARLSVACEDEVEAAGRPSTESHFHALLGRCVAHLHPPAVLAYVCARNGQAEIERLLGADDPPPLWVPYTNPGWALAKRIAGLVGRYEREHGRPPSVLFLQNHGLLASADGVEPLLREVERVVKVLAKHLPPVSAKKRARPTREAVATARLRLRQALFQAAGARVCVRHIPDSEIGGLLQSKQVKLVAGLAACTPDEVVYANGSPIWVEKVESGSVARAIERRVNQEGLVPAAVLAKDLGLFATGGVAALNAVAEMARSSLLVKWQAARMGGARALPKSRRRFISDWEAESYRKHIAESERGGELAGRIALVTGAGSGLGRSIALGLAKAGAAVALADVDAEATRAAADMITEQSEGAAIAVQCDVTNEAQVEATYAHVLDEWGGLDILVNAAGIAPAYDLVGLPVEAWTKTLDVNLTGYFLMGRAAARIMIEQGIGGSIINLSSKSGLEASKTNTPYNATKAGEIHMARGWALELGQHGIRVNSVAPGNVFQGSKIWGPEYIKACAKKYGIKPSEVIPFYVSKTALGREITGQDVADSVLFLCSDRARTITGQTLVPDGGQVFVR